MATRTEELRERGFRRSLADRGKGMVAESGNFVALRSYSQIETDTFEGSPAKRQAAEIHLLRSEFTRLHLVEEETITEVESGAAWRIAMIEDNPVSIIVILHCNQDKD